MTKTIVGMTTAGMVLAGIGAVMSGTGGPAGAALMAGTAGAAVITIRRHGRRGAGVWHPGPPARRLGAGGVPTAPRLPWGGSNQPSLSAPAALGLAPGVNGGVPAYPGLHGGGAPAFHGAAGWRRAFTALAALRRLPASRAAARGSSRGLRRRRLPRRRRVSRALAARGFQGGGGAFRRRTRRRATG